MNPDQLELKSPVAGRIRKAGFELTAVPHAVEKIAAVIEGRLDAGVYLPNAKSPDWRSWDLAAALPLARANEMVLLTTEARPIRLDDLEARCTDAWICASNRDVFDAVCAAIT